MPLNDGLEQGQCGEVGTEMIKGSVLVASVVFEATGSDAVISGGMSIDTSGPWVLPH